MINHFDHHREMEVFFIKRAKISIYNTQVIHWWVHGVL